METAVPVDYNSYFTSFAEATAAASTATSAGLDDSIYYIGQQVYVVDNDEKTVKTYLISHDKTLVSTFDETEPAFTTWKNGKAVAAGYNAVAYSDGATALGNGAQANGDGAVEIGVGTNNNPKTLAFRGFNLASITETETVTSCTIDNARLDIDATLTKSGSPADAKAAGDKFAAADSKAQQALDGVTTINKLIPQDAKPTNQLADKDFVNSSIATNTATFIGTFNLVTDLHLGVSATEEQIGTAISAHLTSLEPPVEPDNHDYCFVQIPFDESPVDPEHIERVDRYKFAQDGSADPHSGKWKFEFSLNNSSFTSEQWATINSGLVEGDATLHLRGPNHDGFSSWAITPAIDNPVSAECLASFQQHYPNVTNGNLTIDSDLCICIGGQKATEEQDLSDDGLVLARNENGWAELNGYLGISEGDAIATRMPLSGYVLGKQDLKPLASEAEAEALRQGKANDADVVHLKGDETVGGDKWFTGQDYFYDLTVSHPQGMGYIRIYALPNENRVHIEFSDAVSSSHGELFLPVLGGYSTVTLAAIENLATDFMQLASEGYVFAENTLCCYQGVLYRCILGYTFQSGDSYPPDDTTHWALATVEDVLARLRTGKADKSDVDPLLFSQYYPEGNVKSAAEFTSGIKYNFDAATRTATVKPFCNTGDSENDNSDLSGRVVIPPFVDRDGNGYISDDDTRFKVVGVSEGSPLDGNGNLTAIVAPNTVTNIGVYAFYGCDALTTISLPAVTSIGEVAFGTCDALTTISLPAATSIGNSAFYGCDALTTISLPAVTGIEAYMFSFCFSLTAVDFGDTPRSSVPTLGEDAFNGVLTSCKIIVPDAQYDAWIAATNWSTLYANGYKFLKHSEWEYARRYELAAKLDKMESITWSDLKAKRDGGNLVTGQQYRITDYVATTNGDMSSQSANKPFDIVVTADDEHTLNESARAIPHEGNSYFDGCDLFAWKVWYCLDNDTTRFMWALANGATDSQTLTTGRGVVYRLIDEFGNDCPYDFKGLKFLAYGDTRQIYRFTFDSGSNGNNLDYSLNDGNSGRKVYGNAIKPLHNNKKNRLNRIVLKGASVNSNTFGEGCNTITVGYGSSCNVFGSECGTVKFGDFCQGNNIGARCMSISAGNYFQDNTFGSGCTNFGFGDNCKFNEFGNGCNHIYFGTAANAQQMLPYYQLIRIEPGVNYVVLWAKSVTGDSSYIYENVTLCAGIHGNPSLAGTEYEYKLIEDTNINQDFKTTYQPANSKFLGVGNVVNTNEVQAQNVNFSGDMNTGEVYLG